MKAETERAQSEREKSGLLVVYTGDGKGKTSAALGLIPRALGRGMRIGILQFVKGKWKTGERKFGEAHPEVDFHVMGRGFTWLSEDLNEDRALAQKAWERARGMISGGDYDIVVLDELTYVLNYGFVEEAEVLCALQARAQCTHVVCTGRNAPARLIEIADLATEMRCIKHPFQNGEKARPGLDF